MARKATSKKNTTKTIALRKTVTKKIVRYVARAWTKDDVRTLKAHSKARTPVTKVAKEMKRTIGALRRKAGILGVPLGEHRRG